MYDVWITGLHIEKVRNLKNINIPVSSSNGERRHVIITGRNGSGKTSLLEAISKHLDWLATQGDRKNLRMRLNAQEIKQKLSIVIGKTLGKALTFP